MRLLACDARSLALIALLVGLEGRALAAQTVHPTPDNLPGPPELAAIIRMDRLSGHHALDSLAMMLRGAKIIFRVGEADGSDDAIFGLVEDIAVDERGRMIVLDSRTRQLRIYTPNGRLVHGVGREGDGPYDFRFPEALEIGQQGRVLVADRTNKVKVFRLRGDTLEYEAVIRLEFVPEDMCVLGDRFYLQAWHSSGTVVHEYALAGPVRSFGDPYRTPNALVENQLSDGPVGCSLAGTVLMMPKYLPVLHGYDLAGRRRWVSRIDSFRPLHITERTGPGGRPEVSYEVKGPFHMAHGITALRAPYVLVQIARSDRSSVRQRAAYAAVESYVVNALTGDGVFVGEGLPMVFAAAHGRLYGAVTDPFPQVWVLEF